MKGETKDYFKGIFFDLIRFSFVYSLIKKQNEILKIDWNFHTLKFHIQLRICVYEYALVLHSSLNTTGICYRAIFRTMKIMWIVL